MVTGSPLIPLPFRERLGEGSPLYGRAGKGSGTFSLRRAFGKMSQTPRGFARTPGDPHARAKVMAFCAAGEKKTPAFEAWAVRRTEQNARNSLQPMRAADGHARSDAALAESRCRSPTADSSFQRTNALVRARSECSTVRGQKLQIFLAIFR